MTARGLPVLTTCGDCGHIVEKCYGDRDAPHFECRHPLTTSMRVVEDDAPLPDWCPLRTPAEPASEDDAAVQCVAALDRQTTRARFADDFTEPASALESACAQLNTTEAWSIHRNMTALGWQARTDEIGSVRAPTLAACILATARALDWTPPTGVQRGG